MTTLFSVVLLIINKLIFHTDYIYFVDLNIALTEIEHGKTYQLGTEITMTIV